MARNNRRRNGLASMPGSSLAVSAAMFAPDPDSDHGFGGEDEEHPDEIVVDRDHNGDSLHEPPEAEQLTLGADTEIAAAWNHTPVQPGQLRVVGPLPDGGGEAVVDDIRGEIAELHSMVETLVAQTGPALSAAYDPDVAGASRTLRFARQTADEVLEEAHAAAAAIVAEAERRRDEIEAETRRQSEDALSSSRERIIAASAAWELQRVDVVEQVRALADAVGRYQDGFVKVDAALHGAVIDLTESVDSGRAF